jgi:crotonobetainyl-CoA:carnitine CoA-transferase CaiB-like acyl-CoA transferase
MNEPASFQSYSVPSNARKVFEEGIVANAWIRKYLPPEAVDFSDRIKFSGDHEPSIPVNWRFAESAAALKALEASIIAALMKRKEGLLIEQAMINTDHAQLFLMSCYLWTVNPSSKNTVSPAHNPELLEKIIPNYNFYGRDTTLYRRMVTNIYRTADGRYFNLHGSLQPNIILDMLGLPHDMAVSSNEEAVVPFIERVSRWNSEELQHEVSDVHKQAGVICHSAGSYQQTEHGKANSHISLFEIHDYSSSSQGPTWWSSPGQNSCRRPLSGLKVVDMSRIIAAPAISRGLAELGASIMRVTSPKLPDLHNLHIDLNWGKWNCSIDLTTEEGKQQLRDLIWEADVVIQGYRPGSLEKHGFGPKDILQMTRERSRGIVVLRENCYGWYGPWSHRSGWQQISDSCVGISHGFGKAMQLENGESVTAIFPNSDYMTGIAGVCAVLIALIKRGEIGGSYIADVALNYYNQWLVSCVGEYPARVWDKLWSRHGRMVFR